MITMQKAKPLKDRIGEFIDAIQDYGDFYQYNEEILDIYEGNLFPYVEKLMRETLDRRYMELVKHRILPINFVQKVVDKLAKSYADEPIRKADDQDFVDYYTYKLDLDSKMMLAEEYSYLNKGYALKPKLTNGGKLKLDVLPYDKFLVIGDDISDPMSPTVFIEFLGETKRQVVNEKTRKVENIVVKQYIAYSDTEIIGFDNSGNQIMEIAENIGYLNPIGQIPFIYGNRSNSNIVPKQDTDFLKLATVLPLMLSDINGALMFQCFTLIYGIDVEFNDATMSPNAIWDLESKPKSDKPAQVGTLTPTVDSDKALTFFKNILAMWLDSKGIDAGSIMQLDSQDIASGLSKAMDELDTTEARKKSIKKLAKEEKALFVLLAKLNNYWLTLKESDGLDLVKVDVELIEDSIEVEFKEPTAKLDYTSEIRNSVEMLNNGLSYKEKEIRRLHPYATEDEINMIFFEYGAKRYELGDKAIEEAIDPENEENMNNQDETAPNMDNQDETVPNMDNQENVDTNNVENMEQ